VPNKYFILFLAGYCICV